MSERIAFVYRKDDDALAAEAQGERALESTRMLCLSCRLHPYCFPIRTVADSLILVNGEYINNNECVLVYPSDADVTTPDFSISTRLLFESNPTIDEIQANDGSPIEHRRAATSRKCAMCDHVGQCEPRIYDVTIGSGSDPFLRVSGELSGSKNCGLTNK
jgi:hypothetical protein